MNENEFVESMTTAAERMATAGDFIGRERRPSRLRASKALPTDRCRFDGQLQALRAWATASNRGAQAVSTEDVAARLPITPATAGLLNGFFVEAGFLTKESRGHYRPTETTVNYAREFAIDPEKAGPVLAEALGQSWYYSEVDAELEIDKSVPEDRLLAILARAAEAENHRPQLVLVLDWLEYAGLIERHDGSVTFGSAVLDELVKRDEDTPADPPGAKPTKDRGETPEEAPDEEAILSFDFSFRLTGEALAKLDPDQITALFQAFGEVMSVKATMKE